MNSNSETKKHQDLSVEIPFSYKFKGGSNYIGAVIFHFFYSVMGLIIGVVCIGSGVFLFVGGISGNISWTAKLLGMESQISDAAPGVILFISGLFITYITRFKLPTFDPTDQMKEVTKQVFQTNGYVAQIVRDAVAPLNKIENDCPEEEHGLESKKTQGSD